MDGSNSLPPKPEPGIRPYLWSLELLTIVQQSKCERIISEMSIAQAGPLYANDLMQEQVDHLRADFEKAMGKHFGVVIHPGDLVVHQQQDYADFGIRLSLSWKPSTKNVQFRAGSDEGWIAHVPDLGVSYQIPVGQQHGISDSQDLFGPVEVVDYRMGGWNELERCWVFTPAYDLF